MVTCCVHEIITTYALNNVSCINMVRDFSDESYSDLSDVQIVNRI